jgi:CspA family cold shock protein
LLVLFANHTDHESSRLSSIQRQPLWGSGFSDKPILIQSRNVMATGTVKFFNAAKGFGFIIPESGGKDIFVHKTAVETAQIPSLFAGQLISYETGLDARGAPLALNLKVQAASLPQAAPKRQESDRAPKPARRLGEPSSIPSFARTANRARPTPTPTDKNRNSGSWLREYERYCELATSASDSVMRENYLQHAEHFFRMMNERSDELDES